MLIANSCLIPVQEAGCGAACKGAASRVRCTPQPARYSKQGGGHGLGVRFWGTGPGIGLCDDRIKLINDGPEGLDGMLKL